VLLVVLSLLDIQLLCVDILSLMMFFWLFVLGVVISGFNDLLLDCA